MRHLDTSHMWLLSPPDEPKIMSLNSDCAQKHFWLQPKSSDYACNSLAFGNLYS